MSSLPPVFIELKASISDFKAKLGEAEGSVTNLEKTTGGVVGKMKTHMGSITTAAGAGMAGLGGFLSESASKMATANSDLESAVSAAGGNMEDLKGKVSSIDEKMAHFSHSSADTNEALAKLTVATQDPNKALGDMSVTAEIAAARHTSLTDAAGLVTKVVAGNTKALKQFGLTGDDVNKVVEASHGKLSKADAALKLIQDRLGKTAENQAKTFHGKMGEIKTRVGDMVAQFGEKFGPALMGVGAAMGALGPVIGGISGAMDFLAANPIVLIIAAIAALAFGLYEAYQHCETFRNIVDTVFNAVKTVIMAVWNDFVKPVFDAYKLVIGTEIKAALWILKGAFDEVWGAIKVTVSTIWDVIQPIFNLYKKVIGEEIGAALTILQTAFDTAWTAISGAVNLAWGIIKPIWDTVEHALNVVITDAINGLKDTWNTVWKAIHGAVTYAWDTIIHPIFDKISGWFDSIVTTISGVGDKLAKAGAGMWDWIKDTFRDIINTLIGWWNDLHFTTPHFHIPGTPLDTPSITIGMPQIPKLAMGGYVHSAGLAWLHPAEVIVPAGRAGPAGGMSEVNYYVTIHVAGHVTTETDLADMVRTKLLQLSRRNVNVGLS